MMFNCAHTSISAITHRKTQRQQKKLVEPSRNEPVTELLLRWRAGDRECLDQLVPLVDGELRRIAHRYLRMERQRPHAADHGASQ